MHVYVCTNTCISVYEYVYCIYSTLVKGWFGFEDLFAEGWIVVDVYNLFMFFILSCALIKALMQWP